MIQIGRSNPAMPIIISSRLIASRVSLAWIVVMLPSWPVFMAWSMSSASGPRHSPMMIRSGRIRSALRTRSRVVTSPSPSMLAGRVSIRTTCGCCSRSSAASSIVATRSSSGMNAESALSRVVLPLPVPPEMMMLTRALMHAGRKSTISGVIALFAIRSLASSGRTPNRRIESNVPSSASGGMIALTRLPSASRASTIGLVSSTRRPTRPAIRWTIWTQVPFVVERDVGLAPAGPSARRRPCLGTVDQDVGDRRVAHQRLERPQAECLVQHLVDQPLALGQVEQVGALAAHLLRHPPDLHAAARPRSSRRWPRGPSR